VKRRLRVVTGVSFVALLALAGRAHAQLVLTSVDGWEVFTSGRVGAFVEVLKGDPIPQAYGQVWDANGPVVDANGNPVIGQIHNVGDGGVRAGASDPILEPDGSAGQGPLLASRVRSGFLPDIFGFGVRRQLTERTKLTGYISIWATAETVNGRTFHANYPDEREAYLKIEGPGGSLLVGRALSLFSRGAVEIDFLYGHGYGVGNPAGFDEQGPTAGHIGYGVVAPVFVSGVAYATPSFHGLQLTAGYYDPGRVVGLYWGRTKYGRPEAEATYDLSFAQRGKVHLFANGAWQAIYSNDLVKDAAGNNTSTPRSASVYGGGAGGRLEVGPFHLGVAAHRGQGIGVGYFLDGSDADFAQFTTQQLRTFNGAYVQTQVVAGQFDFNVGWGETWIDALEVDSNSNWCGTGTMAMPCSGFDNAGRPTRSFLKSQMGWSAVVVYHLSRNLHLAFDYFLSNVKWQQGEQQIVHSFNLGATLTW
jgi:hypothetical protein